MVIRIPSGAQHSKCKIASAVRKAVLVVFIPQRVCDHSLQTVKVADRTPEFVINSTNQWIIQMYSGSLPCTCDQYHELSSQTRHGHKCIPSCQYARSRCKTVQGYCKLQYSQCWPRPIGLALSLQPFANRGEKVSQTSSNPRFENPPPTDNEQPSLMGTPTWTPWHKL